MGERFSIQAYLEQMRREQREDHNLLVVKVDEGFGNIASAMSTHELQDEERFGSVDKRLSVVENSRRAMLWLAGVLLAGAVTMAFDLVVNHFSHH